MAENKSSFILYADLINTVSKLPREKAGDLFMQILEYVNDLDPKSDDLLIQIAFEPIKLQLKRDLKTWETERLKRSEAGRLGGLNSGISRSKTKQNEAVLQNTKQNEANEAVTVTVNVTDTVKEKKEKKDNGVHKFTPPSFEDVQNFIEQQSYSVNADSFFNFYESKGWMIGKNKMKDWKSAVRTWNTKNKAEQAASKDDRFISLDYDFDNLDNWKIIESENKLKPNHNVMAIEIRNGVNAGKFLDWETVSKSRKLRQFFEQFASSQIEGLSYFCKEKYGMRKN